MKIKKFQSSMEKKSFNEIFDRYKVLKKILGDSITVLDVGSNEGQTILEINKNFKNFYIHCFEPLEVCQNKLNYLKSKIGKKKIIINRIAVGNKNLKSKSFYMNKSSNLSSVYKINTNSKLLINMKKLSRDKNYLKTINIPTRVEQIKLDNYISANKIKKIDLLKIDTQGSELEVLKGCISSLKKIKAICVEINFWDYYKKSSSFFEIEKIIKKEFMIWDISFIYKNPKYNSTDWVDAIYINKKFAQKILR